MVQCTYTVSWPKCTYTERAPCRTSANAGVCGAAASASRRRRSDDDDCAGGDPAAKVSRCPSRVLASTGCPYTHHAAPPPSNTGPAAVTVDLFVELIGLAATIPSDTEVERALAMNFQAMGSAQSVLTSYQNVRTIQSARNANHRKAIADEQFRTELVSDLLQYVSNVLRSAAILGSLSGASKRRGSVKAAFHADLVRWVHTDFIPSVRERLPDSMLSPLLAAAYDSDWCRQLQITPPSLSAAAASPGTGGGASMLAAARRHQLSIGTSAGHQTSEPTARRLAFGEFQHLPDRCEKCAAECKSARSRLVCSCGAICCKACYDLTTSEANVTGYQCDACREQHKGVATVFPSEDCNFCFACTAELPLPPSLEIQSRCPDCRCRFCRGCAAVALIEVRDSVRKRRSVESCVVGEAAGVVTQQCPTCAGFEEYEKGREAVCSRLLTKILGRNYREGQPMQWAHLTRPQLKSSKAFADELGDLLYDLYFNGFRDAFAKFLPPFLELVAIQLGVSICPSVDPFHLLYYMGQDPSANTYLLARVCRAQAEESLRKSKGLLPKAIVPEAGLASSESLPEGRPPVLRVGIFGADVAMNSPTADLLCGVLEYFVQESKDSGRFDFFLFADGPSDDSHPSAKHIVQLFEGQLELFTSVMSSKEKYTRIAEKELHILVTLTGWTHGHIAEVIAAVGSGPSPVLVFNWLGWAGPFMCMPEAVHFTIVGSHALSPRQMSECMLFRERLATVDPCYQPAQGPLSHPILVTNHEFWTRSHFNLPSAEENFIYFFAGAMNRILEATFYMWLGIVHRVVGACLLLLSRPKGMRTRIKKWIAKYIATANPDFDPSRVLFRPFQNKTHFCGLIRAVVENGAGVGLDTVEPIAPHTTANDLHAHGCGVLTYVSEGGFHQRVVFELQLEYGLNGLLVAKSRAEFPDLCVRYACDKLLQRAVGQYLRRVNEQRVQGAKLPRQLLKAFDLGFDMFMTAGRDYRKLQDFSVTDELPPIQTFVQSPEYKALAADVVGPDAAKRKELLAQMRAAGLKERMEPHALKIMDGLQRKGLSLIKVVGAGAFSIAISTVAEQSINASVPAGTKVALKVSTERVSVDHIKNNSLARECVNMIVLEKRLERQEWSDVIAAPVYLWDAPGTGRCFWGHTEADEERFCLIFACVELIDDCFADVMKPFGEQWMLQGIIGEGFQDKVLRALFQLLFELQHTAGLSVMDVKGANVGVRANKRLAILDLGNAVAWPLLNSRERQTSPLPVALTRNASLSINEDGQPVKVKGRKLFGSRDASSGLSLLSNRRVSEYCLALSNQDKGWGRVSQAGGTFGYADQKHKGQKLTLEGCYAADMFAGGRCVLKLMTHKRSNERLEDWEHRACQAAADGQAGIRHMLEKAVDQGVRIAQTINVERLANLLAGLLHPDPKERMGAKEAMLHAANTLPSFSPDHSLALASARGIVMAGGPVESLAVPFRECPGLKGTSLPPIALLQQADMGMGAKLLQARNKGEVVAVYGGEHIPRTDTGRLRRAFPSRYGVSVLGVKGFEAFVCDAAQTPKRPLQWFIENSNAGPFMNGRDGVGYDINCDLDRTSAWLDGQGGVWFVVRANRDIDEGEWLMWKYSWNAGPGIAIPGLTFAFD